MRVGDVFGRLTVLSLGGNDSRLCKCACGRLVNAHAPNLANGTLRSCGCDSRPKTRPVGRKQFSWQGTKGAK